MFFWVFFQSIPALRSFCVFCGIGILSVYAYQASWFVAWMTLDERRKMNQRYALAPCVVKSGANGKRSSQSASEVKPPAIETRILKFFTRMMVRWPVQIFILSLSGLVLGLSIYGNLVIEQQFDPWQFLPPTAPVRVWKDVHFSSFPNRGEHVLIISEGGGKPLELDKFDKFTSQLQEQDDVIAKIDSWYLTFKSYHSITFPEDPPLLNATWDLVQERLVQFLFSDKGAKYQYLFDFKGKLECGGKLPEIEIHIMEYDHIVLDQSQKGIEAMNRVKDLIRNSRFTTRVFPFSNAYSVWEIDEIIRSELYRNLGLASLGIFITTLVLLSSVKGSLVCMLSVFLTLVNVAGIMYYWGLTIDTITCTVLIVCIGLSVDFSAHIVHAFMKTTLKDALDQDSEPGSPRRRSCARLTSNRTSRKLRMRASVEAIAPPVLHGGFSTILAVVLLALSDVYVFVAFFKIFVLVVSFGLYNGVVLLPVSLSLLGPSSEHVEPNKSSYVQSENKEDSDLKSGHDKSLSAVTPLPITATSVGGSSEDEI